MPLSPLQGGTTIKPNSTDPRPTAQTYFRDDCTTLVVHDFLNELISLFVNANAYLGLPNAQNDPDALRKMFQAVFTAKKDFQVSDLEIYHKVKDRAALSFYTTTNLRGGYITLNETFDYLSLSKQIGGAIQNEIILRNNSTDFIQTIKTDKIQELTPGKGVDILSEFFLNKNRLYFGSSTENANSKDYIDFSKSLNTYAFFANDDAGGANLYAGGATFGDLRVSDIIATNSDLGLRIENISIKAGEATIPSLITGRIESPGSVVIQMDTNNNSSSDFFEIKSDGQLTRFRLSDEGLAQIRKKNGGEVLSLIDDNAANSISANPHLTFRHSAIAGGVSNRIGYIGYGSKEDDNFTVQNDVGNIRYIVSLGDKHLFNESLQVTTVHANEIKAIVNNEVNIEGVKITSNGINFGQGELLDNYQEVEFIPTVNFAIDNLLTIKEGFCVRIGAKMDVFIRIAGPESARITSGGTIMQVGNIPGSGSVTRRSIVNVLERFGTYPNGLDTKQAQFETTANVFRFVNPLGTDRSTAKTIGQWAGGEFDFTITGTLFFK